MSHARTHACALTARSYAKTARNRNCLACRAVCATDKAAALPPERILRQSPLLCASFYRSRDFAADGSQTARTRRSTALRIHRRTRLASDRTWRKSHQPTKSSRGSGRFRADLGSLWSFAPDCRCLCGKLIKLPPLCHIQCP